MSRLLQPLPQVVQAAPSTGCIPAGIEWLLRYVSPSHISFAGFQQQFDLGPGRNDFGSVSGAVAAAYPRLRFQHVRCASLADFQHQLTSWIAIDRPCLVAISVLAALGLGPRAFHAWPVVEVTNADLELAYLVHPNQQRRVPLSAFAARFQQSQAGGRDVLALTAW